MILSDQDSTAPVTSSTTIARHALKLPRYPRSWYRLGFSSELKSNATSPISRQEMGKELIAFRTSNGEATVLNGRCSHLGAKLKYGKIVNDSIECALHGWCYSASGACVHLPAEKSIPSFAKQTKYVTAERFGEVFYFLGDNEPFDFPKFATADFSELYAARPFSLRLEAPYYMVTGNGFDLQHFRQSHDRTLLDEPVIDNPSPNAIRVSMRLGVDGDCLRDSIIRKCAGSELNFSYTCWGGTLGFVEAQFERAHSYGFVAVTPLAADAAWYSNTIFVKKKKNFPAKVTNFINAELRRMMIWNFLKVDINRIEGTYAAVDRFIESDNAFHRYLEWIQRFN